MNEEIRPKKICHVVVDIETLSTQSNAVVLSIGVALVNNLYSWGATGIPKLFRLSALQGENKGLHICPKTTHWWSQQSLQAREDAMQGTVEGVNSRNSLKHFLDHYLTLLSEYDQVRIWGNGANFDPVILGNCMDAFDVKVPWLYKDVRCLRTLLRLTPNVESVHIQPEETKHMAMHDAQYEADKLAHCLQTLHILGVDTYEI